MVNALFRKPLRNTPKLIHVHILWQGLFRKTFSKAGLSGLFLMALLLFPIQNVGAQGGFDSGGGNNSSNGVSDCTERNAFLTFPNWFRDLKCEDGGTGAPVFTELDDIWTVGANILDIIIQLAGLLAVGFIIYGGIRYITSQGEPENLQSAKKIITNAVIGLVLAILSSTIVGFIAGSFS